MLLKKLLLIELNRQNELDLLGKIRHPNIVSLVGFCIHEENRFIVYELMENGSLDSQLHGINCFSEIVQCFVVSLCLLLSRDL